MEEGGGGISCIDWSPHHETSSWLLHFQHVSYTRDSLFTLS